MESAETTPWRNKLVLCCSAARDVVDTMEEMARPLEIWDEIIPAYDRLSHEPSRELWPLPVGKLFDACYRLCGYDQPDELWVGHLEGYIHRLIFEAYPKARIVWYESGFDSACPAPVRKGRVVLKHWRAWPGLIRRGIWNEHFISTRLCDYRLAREHLARVRARYRWLGKIAQDPDYLKHVSTYTFAADDVNGVLDAIRRALPATREWNPPPADRPRVLLLSQMVTREYVDRLDAYREGYRDVISRLVSAGYVVFWKEHPRSVYRLGPVFQVEFGADRVFVSDEMERYPVELFARHEDFSACVAISSSSLRYIQEVQGIPGYTCADRFLHLAASEGTRQALRACLDVLPSWTRLIPEDKRIDSHPCMSGSTRPNEIH